MRLGAARYALLIAVLYSATVLFNINFEKYFQRADEGDVIRQVFGGMRQMIASWAYMKAEEYHHGGLPFMKAAEFHSGGEALSEERSGVHHECGDGAECAHRSHYHAALPGRDLYTKIYEHVKVTRDTHLSASQGREILPWFYIAVKFDPHDIRGYVLGAYSLRRLKRYTEQLTFLQEGAKNNPSSARILTSLGEFYFTRGAYAEAFDYLSRACGLWRAAKGINEVRTDYERMDRLQAYDLLGAIYEKQGLRSEALKLYKEIHALDQSQALSDKIARLRESED